MLLSMSIKYLLLNKQKYYEMGLKRDSGAFVAPQARRLTVNISPETGIVDCFPDTKLPKDLVESVDDHFSALPL